MDHEARQLCESSQSTPLSQARYRLRTGHQLPLRRASARSGVPATWSSTTTCVLRRVARARRGVSSYPSSTAASWWRSRPRPRTTSISARSRPAPAASSTRPTRTPKACSSTRSRSSRRAGCNEWIWRLLRDNIRAAQLVVGDMEAQVAACRIGADRFLELSSGSGSRRCGRRAKISWTTRSGCSAARSSGSPTAAIPRKEGSTASSTTLTRPTRISSSELRSPSRADLHVDLTGTSPQVDLPINMPFEGTVDIAVLLTVRSILLDTATHEPVPTNSGFPPDPDHGARGNARESTLPAPVIARFCSGNAVADTVMRALSQVVPDNVSAGIGHLEGDSVLGPARRHPLGVHGHHGGKLRRPAGKDGSTPSTPSTRIRATTRSRTSSPTTRSV